MIKLTKLSPGIKKAYNKCPERIVMFFILITTKQNFFKICTIPSDDPYPFMPGKVKYSDYIYAKLWANNNVLMPKNNFFATLEMIKAGVRSKILYDYIFNNLYVS